MLQKASKKIAQSTVPHVFLPDLLGERGTESEDATAHKFSATPSQDGSKTSGSKGQNRYRKESRSGRVRSEASRPCTLVNLTTEALRRRKTSQTLAGSCPTP
eukprot:764024-Hanusia_phi.AAC.2